MASIPEVQSQIRFALDQLRVQNAHHQFEHLCRHYARARICSNILPATGPVAAGGDQGRDFETFRTHLNSSSLSGSAFLGLATNKAIVFACTLQQDDVPAKIKTDVQTILAGAPVDEIHCLCGADLPVAKRHELEVWARDNHNVDLVIHDGQAVSEGLTASDVFWIATAYLNVPSEIYPPPSVEKEQSWYQDALAKWKSASAPPSNYADFGEIKDALRHATFTGQATQDLPFWLSRMEAFLSPELEMPLARRAAYEITVASLRGLGTLLGQEQRILKYFEAIPDLYWPADFEDAVVLAGYCFVAAKEHRLGITSDDAAALRHRVEERLDAVLAQVNYRSTECGLLEIRGYLGLSSAILGLPGADCSQAIASWRQLVELAQDARLFPLDRFADRLTQFSVFLADHPEYESLTAKVDELLAARTGPFAAAEKCRDRALAFFEQGKLLKAIQQIHRAKIDWYASETLDGCILAMRMLSECYSQMGLGYAAKYYALSASALALQSDEVETKERFWRALAAAANCEYGQGAWLSFIEITAKALVARAAFADQAGDMANDEELQTLLFHSATLLAITARIAPESFGIVADRLGRFAAGDVLDHAVAMVQQEIAKQSDSELWKTLEEQLHGRPLCDTGVKRTLIWRALGITWKVELDNAYDPTIAAEEFASTLQILQADLAHVDLCLLPTTVEIEFSVASTTSPRVDPLPSNKLSKWRVVWPKEWEAVEDMFPAALSVATTLLATVSLIPHRNFMEILDERFRAGLPAKVFFGRPYSELLRNTIDASSFCETDRRTARPAQPSQDFSLREHPNIGAASGPGPGYSLENAQEHLSNRYRRYPIPVRQTLRTLCSDPQFLDTVRKLRSEGWRDWHIIGAVFTAAMNYRMKFIYRGPPTQAENDALRNYVDTPEPDNASLVPREEFTEERLRFHQQWHMLSALKTWGLEIHQATPDIAAVQHILAERYGYWTDDIEHPNPFANEP